MYLKTNHCLSSIYLTLSKMEQYTLKLNALSTADDKSFRAKQLEKETEGHDGSKCTASSHYPSPPIQCLDDSTQLNQQAPSFSYRMIINDPIKLPKQPKRRGRTGISKGPCVNCGITTSPFWRRDPEGKFNCNACGLYRKYQQKARPVTLNRAPRKRRSTTAGFDSAPSTALISSMAPSLNQNRNHVRSKSASSDSLLHMKRSSNLLQQPLRRHSSGIDILCNVAESHKSSSSLSTRKLPSLKDFLTGLRMANIMGVDLGKRERRPSLSQLGDLVI